MFPRYDAIVIEDVRTTKMANNQNAFDRTDHQSYQVQTRLPLHRDQPIGEEIPRNEFGARSAAPVRATTCDDTAQRQGIATLRIKQPLFSDHQKRLCLVWCLARRNWNLGTWRKIHWSDESRFLLLVSGQQRVWRHKSMAFTPKNIKATVVHGGESH